MLRGVEEGGLGVPNLRIFIQALKISWLRKLLCTNHKWKNIVLNNYPLLKEIGTLGPSIPCHYRNVFWTDVMNGYTSFFYKIHPNTSQELLAEPMLFNERITIGKRVLSNNHWIANDVRCIGHFMNGNGHFLSHAEFTLKYNVNIDFVTHGGCKEAIKKYIRSTRIQIQNNHALAMNTAVRKLSQVSKGSKLFYDVLIKDDERPNCCSKWEHKLNRTIHWGKCFHNMHKIQDVNLKWFQMRIMHRIIGTNVILKHMNVVADESCSFCGNDRESIEHMFWQCETVKRFWTDFIDIVSEKVIFTRMRNIRLSECLVVLGTDDDIKIDYVFYLIILLAKQYLYKCKMDRAAPNIAAFRNKLASRYKIEEHNARLKCSHQDFCEKWSSYKQLCTVN